MPGKRPDQYNIDPGEAGATDHKSQPQVGQGNSSLDDTVEGDRQRLAESNRNKGGQPFPPDIPAPSTDVNRRGMEASSRGEEEESE